MIPSDEYYTVLLYFSLDILIMTEEKMNLPHCRLNELSYTLYWNILISILGISGYMIRYS